VGGHSVPERKIRARYRRIWPLIAQAIAIVETTYVYDNSSSTSALRRLATFEGGALISKVGWPDWTPSPLLALGG
jgi:predicted ABC-type ATPase